jgi:hypothetical protein
MSEIGDNNHAQYQRKMRALLILVGLVCAAVLGLLAIHAILVGNGSLLFDLWNNSFAALGALAMLSGLAFPVMMVLFALIGVPLGLIYLLLKGKSGKK